MNYYLKRWRQKSLAKDEKENKRRHETLNKISCLGKPMRNEDGPFNLFFGAQTVGTSWKKNGLEGYIRENIGSYDDI